MKLCDLAGITEERYDQLFEQIEKTAVENNNTYGLFRDVFEFAKTLQPGEATVVGYMLYDIYTQIEEMADE